MTPQALIWLTFGPYLFAVLVALFSDAFGPKGSFTGASSAALLLAAGGLAGMVGGWLLEPVAVYRVFMTGGAHSAIPGLIGALGAAAVATIPEARRHSAGQAAALVAFGVIGAGAAAATNDLLMLLIALEIAAVSAYALTALARNARSAEAALKYFILGSVATALFVFGVAVVAPFIGGNTEFKAAAVVFVIAPGSAGASAGLLLILAALLLKAGAAPLHWWVPDAYSEAPPFAAAFMAGAIKLGMVGALGLFVLTGFPAGEAGILGPDSPLAGAMIVLGVVAALSIVIGALGALGQRSYTRMLAYAGIAQVGYALIALSALNPAAAFILAATYAVAATLSFSAAGAFSALRPQWDGSLTGLAGLGREHPVVGTSVAIALVSLAGIPPLVGFWGKFQVFGAAMASAAASRGTALGNMYVALVAVGAVGAVISLGYYASIIRALFFDETPAVSSEPGVLSRRVSFVLVTLAIACLAGGVLPLLFGLSRSVSGFTLGL